MSWGDIIVNNIYYIIYIVIYYIIYVYYIYIYVLCMYSPAVFEKTNNLESTDKDGNVSDCRTDDGRLLSGKIDTAGATHTKRVGKYIKTQ